MRATAHSSPVVIILACAFQVADVASAHADGAGPERSEAWLGLGLGLLALIALRSSRRSGATSACSTSGARSAPSSAASALRHLAAFVCSVVCLLPLGVKADQGVVVLTQPAPTVPADPAQPAPAAVPDVTQPAPVATDATQPAPSAAAERAPASPESVEPTTDAERPPIDDQRGEGATWYGHLTLLADAGSIGLLVLGASQGMGGLVGLGLLGYVVATPILHWAHDNDWAPGSLVLRIASPVLLIVGAVLALGCALSDGEACGGAASGEILLYAGLGIGIAMPIVDAVLAFEEPSSSGIAFTPWIDPRAGAGGVALAGRM